MIPRQLAGAAIAALVACSAPQAVARDTLAYGPGNLLPLHRLHSDARLDTMSVKWASEELVLMKEPRLDPSVIDGEVFRMLYRPSFRSAVAIRVTDTGSACRVVRKEAVQRPSKEIGKEADVILLQRQPDSLVRADSFPITETDCKMLRSILDSLRLEVEPDFSVGPDGEIYLFERLLGGRYFAREAWSPDSSRSPQYLKAGIAFLRWAR